MTDVEREEYLYSRQWMDALANAKAALAAPADERDAPIPCGNCRFEAGCKAHGSCRIEYDRAIETSSQSGDTHG